MTQQSMQNTLASSLPDFVWVLGASTGGPEAVKSFLDHLPRDLSVAFIYAQHIDPGCEVMLSSLGRHCHFSVKLCQEMMLPQKGDVIIVPTNHSLSVGVNGAIMPDKTAWNSPYTPHINSVIAKVCRAYQHRSGVIIFSGMQDDGAESIADLQSTLSPFGHLCSPPVWVQSPTSCVSSSMPEAALATGNVDFQGSPKELARRMSRFIRFRPKVDRHSSSLTVGAHEYGS